MSLPVSVPYAFANATTTQNLSSLDANFNALANGLNGLANGSSQISISSISATGTANATTYLRGDGSWSPVSGGGGNGTVTSVTANSSVSGFSFTGGPITSSGTLTFNGPNPGLSGNVLTSNGTSWVSGAVSVPQGAKAWVNFNGTSSGTITPRASYNVSSVTKNATGDYTLNFTTALADTNYAPFGMAEGNTNAASNVGQVGKYYGGTMTTSAFRILVGTNGTGGAVPFDSNYVSVGIFGN